MSLINRFHSMGLRTKLMLLLLIITVLPLGLLGMFSYRKASTEIQIKAYEIILENLSQVNHSLTDFVQDIEQLSMYIYSNEDIQEILSKPSSRSVAEKYEDEQTVNGILKSFLGFKSWDIELYVIGVNGERYFTGDFLPPAYRDYQPNWGLFRKTRIAGGGPAWDTHYSLKKIEDYGAVLSSGRLLKSIKTGETLGYFIVDIKESALADKYQKAHQYPGGEVYLLDANGYVISSSPSKQQVGTRLNKSYMAEVLSGTKGYFSTVDEGSDKMIIYDSSDSSGFKMVSVVPIGVLTKESHSIRNLTIFIVISCILISYCIAYLLSDYMTRPLRKLRLLMNEVEKGRMDVTFPSKYGDEVGHLGRSFNTMLRQINRLIREGYEKQIQVQEAEIKAIQAQFTPHFLYNALDSINWMARIHGMDAISKVALSLGNLLRFSIRRGNPVIPIREDMKQISNYLTIVQLRYRDKINIELDIDEGILDLYTPKLLLQPLVENAVGHGLEMKEGQGTLRIWAGAVDRYVQFIVEDDGVGMTGDKLAKLWEQEGDSGPSAKTRIGLHNLKKRLELHFGTVYQLEVESEAGTGTKVTIRIPCIADPKEVERVV
ncbi:sensor histidine kinase [Paenibacillus sp. 7124]|uniref:histidine kinase n=1 Tax=Paenibacillus apii TaxID=1850370 RepID=A0A6M1PLV7_9BACL|nr:sensor histidine kinase [Paenibacillus apii]NGM83448.1 sensor histidine kinase [Paenibacillus apii]NJJ39079.1 sensor histidine kinase [Paenibacillus apii]